VLCLDELSPGLDLQSRMAVWQVISGLQAEGSTIFLATHDLGEASRLADTIVVIDAGQIRATGSPLELKETLGQPTTTLHLRCQMTERQLVPVFGNDATLTGPGSVRVLCAGTGEQLRELLNRAYQAGLVIDQVEVAEPSLEDIYLRLTGKDISIHHNSDGAVA
jgi:ABC-2 type transport system ATP-binding protein